MIGILTSPASRFIRLDSLSYCLGLFDPIVFHVAGYLTAVRLLDF